EITRILDVKPTSTQRRGQPFSKRPKYIATIGGWFLDSISHVKQRDASSHVEWILDQVAHSSGAIRTLKVRGYRIDIHVGWFVESNNTCPSLIPAVMRRVGLLDIECWFDIYLFPEDDL
ncbi:MAG: DUF4279 domain-containing protein, partial [Leptolyngbya sp.]|nr:DUF4279 domain-containing protein [Candidatus Melainabacteria bacterium]